MIYTEQGGGAARDTFCPGGGYWTVTWAHTHMPTSTAASNANPAVNQEARSLQRIRGRGSSCAPPEAVRFAGGNCPIPPATPPGSRCGKPAPAAPAETGAGGGNS